MKKIIVLAMLFVTMPAATFGQTARNGKTEEEISTLYTEFRRAIEKRDVTALRHILADDYTDTDVVAGTKQTKQEIIEAYKVNPLPVVPAGRSETVNISGAAISVHGDTAVLTSSMMQKGQDATGRAFSVPLLVTTVFAKQAGQWHVIATHGSRIDMLQSRFGVSLPTSRVIVNK